MAVRAIIGIQLVPLPNVLVLKQGAAGDANYHRDGGDRQHSDHVMFGEITSCHVGDPFWTLRMMTNSTPAAKTTATSP